MQFTVGKRNDGSLGSNPDDDAGCFTHLPRRGIADNMWRAIPSVATTVPAGTSHRINAYHIKTHTVPNSKHSKQYGGGTYYSRGDTTRLVNGTFIIITVTLSCEEQCRF